MRFYDFEYDGTRLSDLGYITCEITSNNSGTFSNGSELTFNTVSTMSGAKYELTSSEYDSCLETTFQICKNPCYYEDDEFYLTPKNYRDLMVWLNRKDFKKLKLFGEENEEEFINSYFEASFNINRIEEAGRTMGAELTAITNRPFALHDPVKFTIETTEAGETYSLFDISDDEGYIYPLTEISVAEDGNLSIYNSIEERTTYIGNCQQGEVITLDYPIISTTNSSHTIQNDFNWNFLRIANSFRNRKNDLTISIPCTIVLTYSPAVKIGM